MALAIIVAAQIGIGTEQLNEIIVLELLDGLKRPIVPSEVEIGVDPGSVLPIVREAVDDGVQDILFVEQLRVGAELQVVSVLPGDLKRTIPIS